MDSPTDLSADLITTNVSNYARLQDVFRSWFWRYYDHLGHLLFYNLGWFLTCLIVGWLPFYTGFVGHNPVFFIREYLSYWLLYLAENAVSVGWAYLIFKIFIQGEGTFADILVGVRRFFLKAMAVSTVSAIILGLGFYNLWFCFSLNGPHPFWFFLLVGVFFWVLLFWVSSMVYQWPVLFFQNPPLSKIFYRSSLLVLSSGLRSLWIAFLFSAFFIFFCFVPFLWAFIGPVFFFSFQCVVLEKRFLRYKITYEDKPIPPMLELFDRERERGWRDFLRPWENR